jgi:HK97 family phage prohead protease
MERRTLHVSQLHTRSVDGKMRASGYAATYNKLSKDLGGFVEKIASRAFDRVLRSNPDTVLTVNHSENHLLARTNAGTLKLRGDDKGLFFDAELPNTTLGRDTYELLKRGDLCSCSFAFTVADGMCDYREEKFDPEFDEDEEGVMPNRSKAQSYTYKIVRTIRDFASLHDVSIVTTPAYNGTSVDARNLVAVECRSAVNNWRKNEAKRLTKIAQECSREAYALEERDRVQKFVRQILTD